MSRHFRSFLLPVWLGIAFGLATFRAAQAGPELSIREFASGQIKKGVRSIGMGGDGATWGNYALVFREAGSAIVDYGYAAYHDTGSRLSFTAVGFTSGRFWDDAALYVVAVSQHATDLSVWSTTKPSAAHPASSGDGSNQGVFVKFAKPLTKQVSAGLLLSYELSQITLVPNDGAATIRYSTAWRPSGGAGVTWQPTDSWLLGVRVLLNHDLETRTDTSGTRKGLARSYEYRAGMSYKPWPGGLLDVGAAGLERHNAIDGTSTFELEPTLGIEQAVILDALWIRAGRDETTWTGGVSVRVAPFKLDVAYLYDLGAARLNDVFGKHSSSVVGTLTYNWSDAG
jgi:hypothetical protein